MADLLYCAESNAEQLIEPNGGIERPGEQGFWREEKEDDCVPNRRANMFDAMRTAPTANPELRKFPGHFSSVEAESDFYADLHIDRVSVLLGGLKAPLLNRCNRSSVQSKA